MSGPTYEQWVEAVNNCERISSEGKTAAQWGVETGLNEKAISRWIRHGLENGWINRVQIMIEEISGRRRRCIGYVMAKKKTPR